MKLTKDTIARLPLEADKGKTDVIYFDDALTGFGARFRSGQRLTWLIQYRDAAGRTRRDRIGGAELDADQARRKAKSSLAAITLGGDPQAEKTEAKARARLTVGAVADRYLDAKKPKLRSSSYSASSRYLTQHWAPLRNLPVHAVERRDVAARLGEIAKEHGPVAASRARATLSAFYAWAIKEGLADQNPVIGTNEPADGIPSRDRVLDESEIRIVWNACRDDDYSKIVKLLFLTGARRDEIGGLRWSELDLERGVLRIPGERTKNKHPLILTLPATALEILESVPRRSEYVFGRVGAFCAWSYSTAILNRRIAEMAGPMVSWRLHDIRRSVATHMVKLGVLPHVVERVLNHTGEDRTGVAAIYQRHSYEPEIAAALARWANALAAIVDGSAPKVVPLHKAG
jgi:integrase